MANNLWSNYTEKTATPVDADEVMVRDSTDGKNKRLLFGTFWKWVAKKLNEATISELETDNKTIIGAINALNGKTLKYKDVKYNVSLTFPSNGYIEFPTNSETKSIWEQNNLSRLNIIGAGISNWNASIVYGVSVNGVYVYGPSGEQTRNLSIRYYYV